MTQIAAKVIADSINPMGVRLATLQLVYPRFIHAEFMTHRVFSRNASSSRAIPVAKMIDQTRNNPAMPVHWGKNQPGMQANEQLEGGHLTTAQGLWREAAEKAAEIAKLMNELGLHKQIANRVMEPFQLIHVVVSSTEWDNFFLLRDHKDAQPEFAVLARAIKLEMDESKPVMRLSVHDQDGWHLPYVTDEERELYRLDILIKCSVARCARVSYMKHDGTAPSPLEDIELYERLVGAEPFHASPTEHQARSINSVEFKKNFRGWIQHRFEVEAKAAKGLFVAK